MKDNVRYYLIYPNGRLRIEATNDVDAIAAFRNHWSATATYTLPPKRKLIKETREELA